MLQKTYYIRGFRFFEKLVHYLHDKEASRKIGGGQRKAAEMTELFKKKYETNDEGVGSLWEKG